MSEQIINIALPKGRLGEEVYAIFEKAGYGCPEILSDTRKLIFDSPEAGVRYFWVKPADSAVYVERGAADIGVSGLDILLDGKPDVFELLDLNVGVCRLAVAGFAGFDINAARELRVATKFPQAAKDYFAAIGQEIDIIKLNGSIELAPLLGLSDVIVDIVESGKTLAENGLVVLREISGISARLIANKAGFKLKYRRIEELAEKIRRVIDGETK
ncbi:MAG: ATP phosphoribosyltransferase [Oscillospiraceae bacterium]|nr:ATP phosphoribosyltransferase [Oscillospiraceae bacterium]